MQSLTLLRFMLLGTFFAGALGCGGSSEGVGDGGFVSDESSILATLGTLPARTTRVVVSSLLDNQPATNTQVLTPPTSTFAVELPNTKTGHLVLDAVAYDSDGCTQASSMGAVDLPTVRTNLDMPLMARKPRKCGVLDPCADKTLCPATKPQAATIQSVWVISPTDVWAVGVAATIMHFDGTSWKVVPPPIGVTENLFGVWGSAANNLWAVGASGRIIYYNGSGWTQVSSGTLQTLYGVWGVSKTEVWAVGTSTSTTTQGTFLRYDGSQWSPIINSGIGTGLLNSVWADSSKFIYACGAAGLLTRYDGVSWDTITSGTTDSLHSIWGTPGGPTESTLFATGDGGRIYRIRYKLDMAWQRLTVTGTTNILYGIHGYPADKVVYAVGSGGNIVKAVDPYDSFVAQTNTATGTLFGVDLASNGLVWTVGSAGFLGYLDQRP